MLFRSVRERGGQIRTDPDAICLWSLCSHLLVDMCIAVSSKRIIGSLLGLVLLWWEENPKNISWFCLRKSFMKCVERLKFYCVQSNVSNAFSDKTYLEPVV